MGALPIEALLAGTWRGEEEPMAPAAGARNGKESLLHPKEPAQREESMRHARGTLLWRAGETGPTWRITSGLAALFSPGADANQAERFVLLAYGGDLLGVEAELLGSYAFDVLALTPVELVVWGSSSKEALYLQQTTRAWQMAQLRIGSAEERIERFIALIAEAAPRAPWPRLKDIALVTGLQLETVSRVLARRRRAAWPL